jgi:FKBP-type peptidyl-prolyl cis-trans isomerase SlyD
MVGAFFTLSLFLLSRHPSEDSRMQIAEQKVVTFNYILKDDDGNVIDQSQDASFVYLHGASNIVPGLENALSGRVAGDEIAVSVAPEDGYGVRDDSRVQTVPREMFPADTEISPGMQFHAQGPDGQSLVVAVVAVEDETVTVDGNHPLAGVQLNFEVSIVDVRDATADEISHGHAHGPDAHHHA